MNFDNIKSNDITGDNFVLGMMEADRRWYKARELFTKFINSIGYITWHMHNGWVLSETYQRGDDVLNNEYIKLVWMAEHSGYLHSARYPAVGEKMVIIKKSPEGTELSSRDMYCYEVIHGHREYVFNNEIDLRLIEIKQFVFNEESQDYQLYVKKPWKLFSFFRKK